MRNENMIKPLNQQCVQTSVRDSIFRYCWGNETAKTWFITKTLKCFLPKGSRLLLKIEGEMTMLEYNEAVKAIQEELQNASKAQ